MKKQKFPLLLGPRNRNDMRENNRNDKRNFERRDGKKRDFKGKRDYRDRDRKQEVQQADEEFTGGMVEGRNAVIEAFRSGKTVDKLFVLASSQDGPIRTIIREAKKHDTIINYVEKERLDELSTTGKHQGVIAQVASYSYATVEDILARAEEKGEPPFILLLDGIEDPHNLGAIIRTANLAGAHGVIVPKHRAVGLTATVAKTSAGALNYTPVAKVTNLVQTMEMLKEKGIWFVCADMNGQRMYDLDLKGPIGLVIGNEGEGVSRLVRENCDFTATIPMKGDIDSLNASVAAGVLAYVKDYDTCTDEELIARLRAGEREITDYLIDKYKSLVRTRARALYLVGGDHEDLIQEGMLGLFKAVRDYKPGKEASFAPFAGLCIDRQMYSAVASSQRQKHQPLNSFVSLSEPVSEQELRLVDEETPEEIMISRENVIGMHERIKERLSKFEYQVLELYLKGYDYTQIAEKLGKQPKAIDNALQRIRSKVREVCS